jgi:membrane-bound inhibitor of C-type lysozyme
MVRFIVCFCLLVSLIFQQSYAQLLPDNTHLNVPAVQRWMNSNRDFSVIIQRVDTMHKTETDFKHFELLSPNQQDQKLTRFLQDNKLLDASKAISARYGWASLGEYMRFSTRLGNAIAAYFLKLQLEKLPAAQQKALKEKADPAVLAVPASDVAFVQANETLLKNYIQAYSTGR